MTDQAFPNRPDHPDFWLLASVVVDYDAAADSAESKEEKYRQIDALTANLIDGPSLAYMAQQRALRALGIGLASELVRRNDEVFLLAGMYYEAVLFGIEFERRRLGITTKEPGAFLHTDLRYAKEWRGEVTNGDTMMGYDEWYARYTEDEEEEL